MYASSSEIQSTEAGGTSPPLLPFIRAAIFAATDAQEKSLSIHVRPLLPHHLGEFVAILTQGRSSVAAGSTPTESPTGLMLVNPAALRS